MKIVSRIATHYGYTDRAVRTIGLAFLVVLDLGALIALVAYAFNRSN